MTARVDYLKWARNLPREHLLVESEERLGLLTCPHDLKLHEGAQHYLWRCLVCGEGHSQPKEEGGTDRLYCDECSIEWKDVGQVYYPMPSIQFEACGHGYLWMCPGCNSWETCTSQSPEWLMCSTCDTRWKRMNLGDLPRESTYAASKTKMGLIFENDEPQCGCS